MSDQASTDKTIDRTPNPDCPACQASRLHTEPERALYHPQAGHGFRSAQGR